MDSLTITDPNEIRVVMEYRKIKEFREALKAKRAACEHSWNPGGRHHNDYVYDCTKCGETKYE